MNKIGAVFMMVFGAIAVFCLVMAVHGARSEEAQPKWKIVVTLDGPPGKQELTYGNQKDGIHWFATKEDCEKARKGGDPKLAEGLKKVAALVADMKKQHVPIEVTTECRPDNSV